MSELSPAQREALGALLSKAPFAKVVRELGRRFEASGHELYLVGGTVRDALLDRSSPDIDLTTDATPDQILAVVRSGNRGGGVWLQGVRFGTVGVGVARNARPRQAESRSAASGTPLRSSIWR